LSSRTFAGLWVAVVCMLDTDFTPETIVPMVSIARNDAFNICNLWSTDGFCWRQTYRDLHSGVAALCHPIGRAVLLIASQLVSACPVTHLKDLTPSCPVPLILFSQTLISTFFISTSLSMSLTNNIEFHCNPTQNQQPASPHQGTPSDGDEGDDPPE